MDYGHQYNNFSTILISSSKNLFVMLAEGILTAIVTFEVFLRLIITKKVRKFSARYILERPFSRICGMLLISWEY